MAHQARTVAMAGTLLLGGLLTACDSLLEVTNPSAITEENLNGDDQTIGFMVNGVVGELRREYVWMAAHGAMFTDEAIQGHPYLPWNVYDARAVLADNDIHNNFTYPLLQRARGTADELIPKIEAALADRAESSAGLAKAYAYGAYSYVLLADHLCEAPVNVSAPLSTEELYGMAVERFERAISIASAAGAGAADIVNLARVGLARAHLNVGNNAEAIAAASAVPPSFSAWLRYESDASDWQVYNFLHWFSGFRFPGELDLALDPTKFTGFSDLRVPFDPTLRRLGIGTRDGFLPYQPPSYSEFSPGNTTQFQETTDVRFASGLEARYIIAEAGGLSATDLRAFINERRAVGGQGAFAGADAALATELREQRFRDFFLDGHRMGDLRRYKRLHQIDLFPTGVMPGTTQQYGSQDCWPIGANEANSNPNVP
jgi:hypothetical protein